MIRQTGILMIILLFCGIAGCGMERDFERERMLSYMGCKYGEEFEFVENYGGQAGKRYRMILVRSCKNSKRQAFVRLWKKDGKRYYEDNYLACLLQEELEKIEGDFALRCFGECKIYYKLPSFVFPHCYRADMTTEEFLKDPCSMPRFYIYPKNRELSLADFEERAYAFCRINAEKGYIVGGTLSLAASQKDYDLIDEENFVRGAYENYEASNELVFSLDEKGNLKYFRWLLGKPA